MIQFIALDQYGQVLELKTAHPRKELLAILGYQHADKMYQDPGARHIGYFIGGRWLTIYQVTRWKGGTGG